jgi:hypothetical protein
MATTDDKVWAFEGKCKYCGEMSRVQADPGTTDANPGGRFQTRCQNKACRMPLELGPENLRRLPRLS